ncbi:Hypothetical protein CINCED_3A025845 [Cinara cedri]|uniref:Uncharacterized protein n=1 Tax=Cinara cedri TaxID=506608 RepID=A0A5E4MD10_9HEMI|nr:Hypothetical protein CINCED_3A025845 [Cinara cedri]
MFGYREPCSGGTSATTTVLRTAVTALAAVAVRTTLAPCEYVCARTPVVCALRRRALRCGAGGVMRDPHLRVRPSAYRARPLARPAGHGGPSVAPVAERGVRSLRPAPPDRPRRPSPATAATAATAAAAATFSPRSPAPARRGTVRRRPAARRRSPVPERATDSRRVNAPDADGRTLNHRRPSVRAGLGIRGARNEKKTEPLILHAREKQKRRNKCGRRRIKRN